MELKELMQKRRSIRKYKPDEVPKEVLQEILEAALWAPSGKNRQPWEVVAVRGEMRDRVVQLIAGAAPSVRKNLEELFPEKIINITMQYFQNLGGAPVVLLVFIPRERPAVSPEMSDLERYYLEVTRLDHLWSAAAFIQNVLLLATERGLGTCWMSGPKYVEAEISDLLGVEGKELVAAVAMGYPDQSPPVPPRQPNKIKWVGWAEN